MAAASLANAYARFRNIALLVCRASQRKSGHYLVARYLVGLWAVLAPSLALAAAFDIDKVAHFAISYAVADTVAPLTEGTNHPVLYSFTIGMVPGIAKRIWDQKSEYDSREKNQDMVANILGAASGALIGHGVVLYARHGQAGVKYSSNW